MSDTESNASVKQASFGAVIGQVIAKTRTSQGLSQSAFAKQVGLGQSVLSRLETGVIGMTVDQLARCAHGLGSSPSEILRRSEAAARVLEEQGVRIVYERPTEPTPPSSIGPFLTGAAIAAILTLAVTSRE